MKKTFVALALASVAAPSMAEVVLYGTIAGGVEVSKEKSGTRDRELNDFNSISDLKNEFRDAFKDTNTAIVDYGSKIGFKGREQLNDNLSAIWQLEQEVNIGGGAGTRFGSRDSFIGLTGTPGTVKAGYLSTPVKDVNGRLDDWEYSNDALGLAQFTRPNDAVKRAVAASYTTPNMGGFSATAYVSPSDNNSNTLDSNRADWSDVGNATRQLDGLESPTYGVGLNYQHDGGFFADVAGTYVKNGPRNGTISRNSPHGHTSAGLTKPAKDAYQAIAQAGFENDSMLAGVAYQRAENVDTQFDIVNEVAATVGVNVAEGLKLKGTAAYGFNISDASGQKYMGTGKYYQGIVGADYALSKRTVVNAQVGYKEAGKGDAKQSVGAVGVGLKHNF